MVEYYHRHTKIMGLILDVSVCTRIEKLAKRFYYMASSGSTMVEHYHCHTKIMGLSPADTVCARIEKLAKRF